MCAVVLNKPQINGEAKMGSARASRVSASPARTDCALAIASLWLRDCELRRFPLIFKRERQGTGSSSD
jgi:hypothetical protein